MAKFDSENTITWGEPLSKRLIKMRDLYSNRVPGEILHSSHSDNRFKVRRGWFLSLFQVIDSHSKNQGETLDPAIHTEYTSFREYIRPRLRTLTISDEINRANRLINAILGEPEEIGVPYDRVIEAVHHASVRSNNRLIMRWHGMNEDEIASRLPNHHYSNVYDLWLQLPEYRPPSKTHRGWVLGGYTNAYQGDRDTVSSSEERVQSEIKLRTEEWVMGTDEAKRLLILAQTLPSPYIFTNPSFPWHKGPLSHPPYPVWTVSFDGRSQVTLAKHDLDKSDNSPGEMKWITVDTLAF